MRKTQFFTDSENTHIVIDAKKTEPGSAFTQ